MIVLNLHAEVFLVIIFLVYAKFRATWWEMEWLTHNLMVMHLCHSHMEWVSYQMIFMRFDTSLVVSCKFSYAKNKRSVESPCQATLWFLFVNTESFGNFWLTCINICISSWCWFSALIYDCKTLVIYWRCYSAVYDWNVGNWTRPRVEYFCVLLSLWL